MLISTKSPLETTMKSRSSKKKKHIFDQKKSGEYIRFWRKQLSLTQEDVAEHTSITRSHISNVEKGISRFSFEDYLSIAELYRTVARQKNMSSGYHLQWFDLVNGYQKGGLDEEKVKETISSLKKELDQTKKELKQAMESLHLALRREQ